jgi:ABC-type Fe3+-hydroxamate transport system substrate-binding protein
MQYYSQIYRMLFTDQLNTIIDLKSYPKRIVSLVPSQSELLWDLGLREELVGITKFCVHPKELYKSIPKIGGTKTVNMNKVRALKPDLIIGNKEENEHAQILELRKEFPVWMSDIYNLEDSLTMIQSIGALVNRVEEANEIKDNIRTSFLNLKTINKSVLYLIWKNPYMAAGNATFIGDMLHKMGLQNCLTDNSGRYPNLSVEDIKVLNPELILLSSEPYPFKEKHIQEFKQLLPNSKILLVDGELFSWYGSRLLKSVNYFNEHSTNYL